MYLLELKPPDYDIVYFPLHAVTIFHGDDTRGHIEILSRALAS